MRTLRTAAIAALSVLLTLATGTPAFADEPADTTPPEIYSTGLVEGQLLGLFGHFTPTFADDVTSVTTDVGGKTRSLNAAWVREHGIGAWLYSSRNDTDVDITVRVYDKAFNHSELTTRVHMELIAPTAVVTPLSGVVHDTTTINVTTQDTDVAEVTLEWNNQVYSRATSAPWTLTWDTSTFPRTFPHLGGPFVRVSDKPGNFTVYSGDYTVDNVGPEVTVGRITSGGRHRFGATFTDESGVDHVEWWINGALVSTAATVEYGFGRSRPLDVVIKAWDRNGHGSTTPVTLQVDADAPTLAISSGPRNGAKVKGIVKIGAKAADKNGVAEVQLLINGKVVATDTRAGYAFSINTKNYPKKFKVQLRAYDRVGNEVVTSARTWHR
ncbi:Ig-like domain-containing protein [Actinoplanes sp. L3-i22]|uniref:Ig-like domain-containing protein n=1 Tax=Actinoplanes sp. L3-i22 TaxID=2836373 RepID=UPI001C766608|nr:Ig-like domain-containing protein [Actinoplanes sp. L3-i22]BCY05227.1 hypothetical protein L3i22_003150 [Actinoplanes sp. L3-i22]